MLTTIPWTPITCATTPSAPPTFMGLPTEIRLKIYDLLLPDSEPCPGQLLRSDGQRCTTKFLSTCEEVYKEALRQLYSDNQIFYIWISGWSPEKNDARVRFLNREIFLTDLDSQPELMNHFLPLCQIKELEINVNAFLHERVACEVQDLLFKVLSPLYSRANQLRRVQINIDVGSVNDSKFLAFEGENAERKIKSAIAIEFKAIRPGDFSRGHLTAFLADPFKLIRNVSRRAEFKLTFIGERGKVFGQIPSHVRRLAKGNSAPSDYTPFHRYFDVLRPVLALLKQLHDECTSTTTQFEHPLLASPGRTHTSISDPIYKSMSEARIYGDVKRFRAEHSTLMHMARELQTATSNPSITELLDELDKALPPADLDVSMLGYNESDRKLNEWQNGGRDEKKAELKRKKEEKDKLKMEEHEGSVMKKVKIEDGGAAGDSV